MIDFTKIKTYSIHSRTSKVNSDMMILPGTKSADYNEQVGFVADRIIRAKNYGKKVIVMCGGAVIKQGCSLLLIELIKRGWIDHIAGNGSVSIHDFEIALVGQTSEDVSQGLKNGTFGMAEETGRYMNEALIKGAHVGKGYGYSIAECIDELNLPFKEKSILFHGFLQGIGLTFHVAIGGDIIHQHPRCDGAALGITSFEDFKIFTGAVSQLSGGVLLNIGSAVLMPEVFLKALTIAQNLGSDVCNFTTANFDFIDMYRPRTRIVEWPSVLGAEGIDVRGEHRSTILQLYSLLLSAKN